MRRADAQLTAGDTGLVVSASAPNTTASTVALPKSETLAIPEGLDGRDHTNEISIAAEQFHILQERQFTSAEHAAITAAPQTEQEPKAAVNAERDIFYLGQENIAAETGLSMLAGTALVETSPADADIGESVVFARPTEAELAVDNEAWTLSSELLADARREVGLADNTTFAINYAAEVDAEPAVHIEQDNNAADIWDGEELAAILADFSSEAAVVEVPTDPGLVGAEELTVGPAPESTGQERAGEEKIGTPVLQDGVRAGEITVASEAPALMELLRTDYQVLTPARRQEAAALITDIADKLDEIAAQTEEDGSATLVAETELAGLVVSLLRVLQPEEMPNDKTVKLILHQLLASEELSGVEAVEIDEEAGTHESKVSLRKLLQLLADEAGRSRLPRQLGRLACRLRDLFDFGGMEYDLA